FPSSSSKPVMIAGTSTGDYCQFDELSSLQRCVSIPCEPNERPSKGLSLSLSSTNPSSIGLQAFELVRQSQNHHHNHQGHYGKPMAMYEQHDQDEILRQSGSIIMNCTDQHESSQFNLRSSKYLVQAQDLLYEFCSLGTKQNDHSTKAKAKAQRTNQCQDHDNLNNMNASYSKNIALNSLEFLELQNRKSKLLQMLNEVDRKYYNYCDQMKALVSSFEAVAGNDAAKVYSALASKAMSRHFRCLRDEIVGQIRETKKAMGEKDISTLGATKGETPRLRLLDQSLRQERSLQQMAMMDSHPWRPQRGLPEQSVNILRVWLFEHFLHPYPSDVNKRILARQSGLSKSQVSNWFINARVRLWKPMVEEMYMEETKDNNNNNHENNQGASVRFNATVNKNTVLITQMEQKPTVDQLIRRDSDCLSSIINHHDHHVTKSLSHDFHHSLSRASTDSFGAVELDFSAYNHNFGNNSGGSRSSNVSLTLGLQQDAGGGDGVSLYYPRDNMEDCQTAIQYSSLLEGDQGQNLPNRNLMGVQLLHDLAG
ncbi:homeobox protein BEL1 homolog, partial [Bidens hawaiensis]|uniref:homeobox protein BEL1 homolog n=1 Tax=Bidens hawaiensis TaxID=980011 RepID=UPI00404A067E